MSTMHVYILELVVTGK